MGVGVRMVQTSAKMGHTIVVVQSINALTDKIRLW
jgi:hypothetical protein